MGKTLKGKDCGKGIYQRKDGLYSARFVDKTGKRHEKYFQTLPEARNWIEEAKYADKHDDVFAVSYTHLDVYKRQIKEKACRQAAQRQQNAGPLPDIHCACSMA